MIHQVSLVHPHAGSIKFLSYNLLHNPTIKTPSPSLQLCEWPSSKKKNIPYDLAVNNPRVKKSFLDASKLGFIHPSEGIVADGNLISTSLQTGMSTFILNRSLISVCLSSLHFLSSFCCLSLRCLLCSLLRTDKGVYRLFEFSSFYFHNHSN